MALHSASTGLVFMWANCGKKEKWATTNAPYTYTRINMHTQRVINHQHTERRRHALAETTTVRTITPTAPATT